MDGFPSPLNVELLLQRRGARSYLQIGWEDMAGEDDDEEECEGKSKSSSDAYNGVIYH
jgi:hypothetical protein